MIITQAGPVSRRILLMGRPESCVYLVKGRDESYLLGGGMGYIAPELLEQMAAFDIDERAVSHICILHAHFDHCGTVPFLKKRWPWAKVIASRRAKELMDRPEIAESMGQMNHQATLGMGRQDQERSLGFQCDDLHIEGAVKDGDRLACGDIELEVLEVPGHSSCSIALYMPVEKALFASDAVGLPINGENQPTPNSNYDLYQQSLEKLARLSPEILLLEHFGAYTGQDARAYIPDAIKAAQKTRSLLEEIYRRTRDVGKCTQEITEIFLKRNGNSFLSEDVRALVAGQMVRFIAKRIEAEGN